MKIIALFWQSKVVEFFLICNFVPPPHLLLKCVMEKSYPLISTMKVGCFLGGSAYFSGESSGLCAILSNSESEGILWTLSSTVVMAPSLELTRLTVISLRLGFNGLLFKQAGFESTISISASLCTWCALLVLDGVTEPDTLLNVLLSDPYSVRVDNGVSLKFVVVDALSASFRVPSSVQTVIFCPTACRKLWTVGPRCFDRSLAIKCSAHVCIK